MKYCKTCRCKMIRNRHYGSLKTCELVRQHQLQVSQLEERLRVALEQRDAATYHEPMPTDGREQLQQRITELEASMIRHFQEEHLEGDGPEIDRWKRVLHDAEAVMDVIERLGGDAPHRAVPLAERLKVYTTAMIGRGHEHTH